MIRPVLFLSAAVALVGLAACNGPSTLSKAQTGECYRVEGKGSLGEPKLAKVPCGEDGATETASADDAAANDASGNGDQPAAETAQGETAAQPSTAGAVTLPALAQGQTSANGTCQKLTVVCPGGGTGYIATSTVRPKVSAGKAARHRRAVAVSRSHKTATHYASGGGANDYVGLGIDYTHVDTGVARPTNGKSAEYAAANTNRSYSAQTSTSYSSSESSSASASSSESSAASGYAYGYGQGGAYGYAQGGSCCNQPVARGPNQPFDQNGFLTWVGKVPYQPQQRRR